MPEIINELMAVANIEAKGARAEAVEPLHLFIAVCKQCVPPAQRAFEAHDQDPVTLRRRARGFAHHVGQKMEGGPQRVSGRVQSTLEAAGELADEVGEPMNPLHVLSILLDRPDTQLASVIKEEEIPVAGLLETLREESAGADPGELEPGAIVDEPVGGGGWSGVGDSAIDKYGKDYTALARDGKLDLIVGRRAELKQIVRILLRKQKSNPMLLGEPGVGKTAVVEGLALYTIREDVPPEIRSMRIVEIPVASLVAGAKYRGDFEERLQTIVKEAESDPNLVIFFDEIHTIVGAGAGSEAMDAANILKPALARGAFRCIGATTPTEYRKHIEKEAAFERRFQPVRIEEPTPEEAREILEALRPHYEEHHQVEIDDDALDAAVNLSVRYILDRRLPDKARDLIDQAAVSKRVQTLTLGAEGEVETLSVTHADVAAVVAEWTGIPVERLSTSQRDRLIHMEETLRKRVVGQDHAVEAVSKTVRTALSGLAQPNRPYGVFLFTGPSGVGKTELAKALTEFLFDDERHLVRLDMSEYMEEHSVSKLIGSPPGYVGHEEGGRLTNAVRNTPYSVVLLDEIEKANPKVFDLFLQIFDDGRLSDSHGRVTDFSNTVIIMTSNITGTAPPTPDQSPRVGFVRSEEQLQAGEPDDGLMQILLSRFRPEFINRISRVVPFHPLGSLEIRCIIDKLLDDVRSRLVDQGIGLQIAPGGYDALMRKGFRPEFGAREMERVVDREVIQPIAQGILEESYGDGDSLTVDGSADGVVLRRSTEEDGLVTGSVLMTRLLPTAREDVAMLLIDIVGSTRMVLDRGDSDFVQAVRKLHSGLMAHPGSDSMRFLKGTGDGFLVVYGEVATAIQVGRDLRSETGTSIALRMVVHAGRVKVGPDGDPLGREVHRLFRLEVITEDDRIPGTPSEEPTEIPDDGRIMITVPAVDQLPSDLRSQFGVLGSFHLKDFADAEEVWVES